MTERLPLAGHLNYKGEIKESDLGKIVGPNAFNEYLISVNVDYNAQTNMSRVGFDYLREGEGR